MYVCTLVIVDMPCTVLRVYSSHPLIVDSQEKRLPCQSSLLLQQRQGWSPLFELPMM